MVSVYLAVLCWFWFLVIMCVFFGWVVWWGCVCSSCCWFVVGGVVCLRVGLFLWFLCLLLAFFGLVGLRVSSS